MTGDGAEREMRILADVLALLLDPQPGVSGSALANLQARARENGVTGGALKEAWRRLERPGAAPLPHGAGGGTTAGGAAGGAALARVRMELEALRSQVAVAEQGRAQDRQRLELAGREGRLLAALAGLLVGAATTAVVIVLLSHP